MRLADLLRRTSFRLAVAMTTFVLTALLMAGGIGYGLMHAQLTARQNGRVTEIFVSLETSMLAGEERELIDEVENRIAASPDRASIYLLKDRNGRVLAANIPDIGLGAGWSIVAADRIGIVTDYPYRIFTGNAGTYALTVGLTDADLDDLREIITAALGWSALLVLIAAVGAGAVLGGRVHHRLAQVDAALHQVALGDLTARLPLTGQGDDLDRIAASINGALTRLASVVEAMRQVSADIAHDLRTPLNRLRNRLEAAAGKSVQGISVTEDLTLALSESDQISDTFAALLRIAQIEAGARLARFCPLDLGTVLANVVEVYQDVADDAGMMLAPFSADAKPILVNGDAELLTQMIANLIENAIRHCPVGCRIDCTLHSVPGAVRLCVSDTGHGIAEAERALVLRRLYRSEKSRSSPGTGLGLSLVKAIADLHQADITLADAEPGLRVTLRFAQI